MTQGRPGPLERSVVEVRCRRLLTPAAVRLLTWAAILVPVAAMTMPFHNFVGRPFWDNIEWIPFTDPTSGVDDVLENLALFFPFGFLLAWCWQGTRGAWWKVTALGAALSFCGEFYQIFCVHRHPDVTDVLMNTIGSLGGACLAIALQRKP
jgi:glycopeptide antibiotics resistance protein